MADPHNHTHQRRHTQRLHTPHKTTWATLAITALIATVLAVTATPAGAAEIDDDSEPGSPATFTACLGLATDDAGFEDLDGLGDDTTDAINCLAYYGITKGRNGGTQFDPASNVTRGQMALFLYRAANAAGIDLMGGDMDATYGDIDELSEERQAAIKALARNGILTGRNTMSFQPLKDITRAEMAVALVNLVDHTPGAPVSKNKAGLFVLGATNPAPPDDWFADARASVPRHVDNAISAAYELGITTGYPNGPDGSRDFRPNASVPRRNMASFITRALAHSNLRPEGLTAQVDDSDVVVSIRKADFAPVVNQAVDVFRTPVALESKAFKDDGKCSSRTYSFEGPPKKCEIDGADPVTQSDGNVRLTLDSNADVGDGQTVWIWSGSLGDTVDSDSDLLEVSVMKGAAKPPTPSRAVASTDLAKDPNSATPMDVTRAHFGTDVTVTIQLQGDPDASGPKGFIDTVPTDGTSPEYTVIVQTFQGIITENDVSAANPYSRDTKTVAIGADGSETFTISASDPDSDDRNHVSVRYQISAKDGAPAVTAGTPNIVVFSDEPSAVSHVSVVGSGPQVAPGEGGTAGNSVTVTVLDQYGRPFRGAPVVLHSGAPKNDGDTGSTIRTTALVTGARGTVVIRYSYSGGASQETLRAAWDGYLPAIDLNGDDDTLDPGERPESGTTGVGTDVSTCEEEDKCGTTTVSWVLPDKTDNANRENGVVLSVDTDSNQIVYDLTAGANAPMSVNYDENDFFTVVSGSGGANVTPVTLADFEDMLADDLDAAKGTDDEDQPRLTYSSYLYDDPSDIATFTLTLGGSR